MLLSIVSFLDYGNCLSVKANSSLRIDYFESYSFSLFQILCGGQLPFIGLIDKVEQELAWKV